MDCEFPIFRKAECKGGVQKVGKVGRVHSFEKMFVIRI